MRQSSKIGLLGLGLAGAVSALALAATAAPTETKLAGAKVDNFMLPDQTGMGHELFYYKEHPRSSSSPRWTSDATSAKAAGRSRQGAGSLQRQERRVHGARLRPEVESRQVRRRPRLGRLSRFSSDRLQLVGRSLGVTTTGEAFVVDPKTWTVAYHGPIDETFAQKKDKNADPLGGARRRARRQGRSGRRSESQRRHDRHSPPARKRRTSRRSPTPRMSPRSSPPSAWSATPKAAWARSRWTSTKS